MAQALASHNQQIGIFRNERVLNATFVVGGSLLMAVCAHVSIPLWFTPVPITLQTFGVIFLALSLGGWRSMAALTLYLVEGMVGVPVFSPHGPGGIAQLLGPTGGYLMAYPLAAFAGGWIADRLSQPSRAGGFILGAFACDTAIFIGGALWLLTLSHRSPVAILNFAVLPFIPGEILKGTAAIATAIGARRIRRS